MFVFLCQKNTTLQYHNFLFFFFFFFLLWVFFCRHGWIFRRSAIFRHLFVGNTNNYTNERTNRVSLRLSCYPHSSRKIQQKSDDSKAWYFNWFGQKIFPWTTRIFRYVKWHPVIWIAIIRKSSLFHLISVSQNCISVH